MRRLGTLSYNSLPMHLRSISSCSVLRFKTQLYIFLGSVEDLPCLPGFNNSLDGGDVDYLGRNRFSIIVENN